MRLDARRASSIRKVLRYAGSVVLCVGIVSLTVGGIHTVHALTGPGDAYLPLVILALVAVPMIPVGFAMTMFGFSERSV